MLAEAGGWSVLLGRGGPFDISLAHTSWLAMLGTGGRVSHPNLLEPRMAAHEPHMHPVKTYKKMFYSGKFLKFFYTAAHSCLLGHMPSLPACSHLSTII